MIESGKARFRPVLLTSLTTIAGLFPLLLERSFQAQFLIPMAVSICFGLLAATLLTLLYVPALYLIVLDVTNLFLARGHRRLKVASGPEGSQGPTPRREGGLRRAQASRMRNAEGEGRDDQMKVENGMRKAKLDGSRNQLPAAGNQMAGNQSRKMDVREKGAETIRHQRSRPSAPPKQTMEGGTRNAQIKKQKRKVTI